MALQIGGMCTGVRAKSASMVVAIECRGFLQCQTIAEVVGVRFEICTGREMKGSSNVEFVVSRVETSGAPSDLKEETPH